ncbi:hypothetical protein PI23P_03687 [Polaribacter irgensii 23-P]|uniref:Uncharacterized protein n=1 Tax=Polaribacter irgensii 23-P TaxID=313594 RepID=A4BX74_9FLAO|nr:hypothetical protein [Polaribacter irgensii]EAR13565.1 hypothetical protein PI23P_03687 [Polaribacter irgensii 23-P]
MELTKEQLQRVAHYLNVKEITYIDLRTEIFDHIVSDIEVKIMAENLEFETAFYAVTVKWNKHLIQESSFYFGLSYALPKIVLNNAKKVYKKWFFLSLLVYFIPYILLDNVNITFSKIAINDLNIFLQILTACALMVFFGLLILKFKEKNKTTFSFILKTLSWNFGVGLMVLFYLNSNPQDDLQRLLVSFSAAFIFMTYSYFHFYKKHLEAVKKHKIS